MYLNLKIYLITIVFLLKIKTNDIFNYNLTIFVYTILVYRLIYG